MNGFGALASVAAGLAYGDSGDTRKAIEAHMQAVVIAREIGDRRGEGIVLGNLGIAYAVLGDARCKRGGGLPRPTMLCDG